MSEDKTFVTTGYPLTVKIVSKAKKPVADVAVSVDGTTKNSDKAGTAVFDVVPGTKTVVASKKHLTGSASVTVAADTKTPASVTFTIDGAASVPIGAIIGGGIGTFLLGAVASLLTIQYLSPMATYRRKGAFAPRHLKMPISTVQRRYGDNNPNSNPYHRKLTSFIHVGHARKPAHS